MLCTIFEKTTYTSPLEEKVERRTKGSDLGRLYANGGLQQLVYLFSPCYTDDRLYIVNTSLALTVRVLGVLAFSVFSVLSIPISPGDIIFSQFMAGDFAQIETLNLQPNPLVCVLSL